MTNWPGRIVVTAADLLDDAAIFMPHRHGGVERLNAAIGPEIRSTHASRRDADHRVCGVNDGGLGHILEADVIGPVKHGSQHDETPV